MHARLKILVFCLLGALATNPPAAAQITPTAPTTTLPEKADFAFRNNDYVTALPLYQQLAQASPADALAQYRLGVCWLQSPDKTNALDPLVAAVRTRDPRVPTRVYQQLGLAHHYRYQFADALASYERYRSLLSKTDPQLRELDRQAQASRQAQRLTRDTAQVVIQHLDAPINTPGTEYGPVIAADESVLVYTTLPANHGGKVLEDIQLTRKQGDRWGTPASIGLNATTSIGSVGLSPDGQRLLIYMAGSAGGDIFTCRLSGAQWGTPARLPGKVNSNARESSASFTPDEKVLYFSSNRPGGLGGFDLYRATKNAAGQWDNITNLGAPVNTPDDEDAPFIHPDGTTLYFSANGRNSMGGNDLFRTTRVGERWQVPVNLGYPVNTVYDDNYLALTADGKKGYFSSNRPGGLGEQDLYFLGIPEEQGVVPLTMIKGRITTGDQLVPTTIQVIDKKTGEVVKNVYNPNVTTGQYLIIFPPGRDYDMVISAEGFMPQLVNIHVPNQRYFYELYQEINLKPIMKAGKMIGQEVTVNNVFEDVEKNQARFDPNKFGVNNLDLYELMDNVIASSDQESLNYLLDLMYSKTSVDLQITSSVPMQGTYYYQDSKGKMRPVVIDGKTVYALPTPGQEEAFAAGLARQKANAAKVEITPKTVIKPDMTYLFHFATDRADLGREAIPELEKLYDFLRKHPQYGIRVAGFADADGTRERNQQISEQRARQVADYVTQKGIAQRRIAAKGYGAAPEAAKATTEAAKRQFRVTEITVVAATELP